MMLNVLPAYQSDSVKEKKHYCDSISNVQKQKSLNFTTKPLQQEVSNHQKTPPVIQPLYFLDTRDSDKNESGELGLWLPSVCLLLAAHIDNS